ncbi:MAG: hypothetical protein KDJ70_18185, partial [Candidatus Competibacteraceae bacterium]|nr:hypothetical protein [Candidatus Competibacteraceae bacterium]
MIAKRRLSIGSVQIQTCGEGETNNPSTLANIKLGENLAPNKFRWPAIAIIFIAACCLSSGSALAKGGGKDDDDDRVNRRFCSQT